MVTFTRSMVELAREASVPDLEEEANEHREELKYAEWASERGLYHKNSKVRNAAATVLEKTLLPFSRFLEVRGRLYQLMKKDPSKDVRYRSALALAAHGPGPCYESDVKRFLRKLGNNGNKIYRRPARSYLHLLS